MKRVIFYFDGFNFYNGLRDISYEKDKEHWINYYWLDFAKFCKSFISDPNSELIKIKYFTAPAASMQKRLRQTALINANLHVNNGIFQVFNGKFNQKNIDCMATCKETFTSWEEKKTDVSIGINMLIDCYEDNVDRLILISADSDQIPTLRAIKSKFTNKKIQVYFPPFRDSTEIYDLCKPIVYLENNETKFQNSILPDVIKREGNTDLVRPDKWYYPAK